jgi:hypothetical protein
LTNQADKRPASTELWAIPGEHGATLFEIADGKVVVAALIAGDGIDLVVTPPGRRARTIQLTVAEARIRTGLEQIARAA